jgi:hypothetical protein
LILEQAAAVLQEEEIGFFPDERKPLSIDIPIRLDNADYPQGQMRKILNEVEYKRFY